MAFGGCGGIEVKGVTWFHCRWDESLCLVRGSAMETDPESRAFAACDIDCCAGGRLDPDNLAFRLPLGVPSQLPMQALELAEKLISRPMSKRDAGKAAEREAGYLLLGALCASLPSTVLVVRLISSEPCRTGRATLTHCSSLPSY